MSGHDARVRYSLGTNVSTPFFQVPTLEFGHRAGTRVPGLDLVLGRKSRHRVPVCTRFLYEFRAVHCLVLAAKLMFQNGV